MNPFITKIVLENDIKLLERKRPSRANTEQINKYQKSLTEIKQIIKEKNITNPIKKLTVALTRMMPRTPPLVQNPTEIQGPMDNSQGTSSNSNNILTEIEHAKPDEQSEQIDQNINNMNQMEAIDKSKGAFRKSIRLEIPHKNYEFPKEKPTKQMTLTHSTSLPSLATFFSETYTQAAMNNCPTSTTTSNYQNSRDQKTPMKMPTQFQLSTPRSYDLMPKTQAQTRFQITQAPFMQTNIPKQVEFAMPTYDANTTTISTNNQQALHIPTFENLQTRNTPNYNPANTSFMAMNTPPMIQYVEPLNSNDANTYTSPRREKCREGFLQRLKAIPVFSGKNRREFSDFMDISEAIHQFCQNNTEYMEFLLQVTIQLRGEARSMINNLMEWQEIKNTLTAQFKYLSNRDIINSQIENLRQEKNETLLKYSERARELLLEKNMTCNNLSSDQKIENDRAVRRSFSKGLTNGRVKEKIVLRGANSLEETIALVFEMDNDMTNDIQNSELYCNYCKISGHRIKDCRKREQGNTQLGQLLSIFKTVGGNNSNRVGNNMNNNIGRTNYNNNQGFSRYNNSNNGGFRYNNPYNRNQNNNTTQNASSYNRNNFNQSPFRGNNGYNRGNNYNSSNENNYNNNGGNYNRSSLPNNRFNQNTSGNFRPSTNGNTVNTYTNQRVRSLNQNETTTKDHQFSRAGN